MRRKNLRRTQSNKGFTLIETLVALLILSMIITTLVLSYKEYITAVKKKESRKYFYISIDSLRCTIEKNVMNGTTSGSGTFNGIKYSYSSKIISEKTTLDYTNLLSPQKNKIYLVEINLKAGGKSYSWKIIRSNKI